MNKFRLLFLALVLAFVLIYSALWQGPVTAGEISDVNFSTEKVFAKGGEEQSSWWNSDWDFRIFITVETAGYERQEKPAEMKVDFASILSDLGVTGSINFDSLRVLEVDSNGAIIAKDVPFQFDAQTGSAGMLIILLTGKTAAGSERYYHLYFNVQGSGTYPPPIVADKITTTDNVMDEGFSSVKIVTEIGTYYYHKEGGGFSSLNDKQGQDWINYSPEPEAAGDYRGIPNLVPPAQGGYFHPGRSFVTTSIISQGPLKTSILSTTNDDKWQVLWEIFPQYAKLSVLKIAENASYWFLYEGTPGGFLDTSNDYMVQSDETQSLTSVSWEQDMQNEEWVYFVEGDPAVNRSLFLVHHENDSTEESYRPMSELMTVFGFARLLSDSSNGYFTKSGNQFTIGLIDDEDITVVERAVRSAYRDLAISFASPERRPYKLEIELQGEGMVEAFPDLLEYPYGQEVILQANPARGWEFSGWIGDLLGNDPSSTVMIDSDMNITAIFVEEGFEPIIYLPSIISGN